MRRYFYVRNTRDAIGTALALVLAVIAIALAASALAADLARADAGTPAACAEDAPCWNWARMGNHRRGIVTLYGNVRVVGPCQYARMRRAHRIDPHTPRLRGDVWAAMHGCAPSHSTAV